MLQMYGMGAVCLAYAAAGVTAVALTFITLSPAAYYAVMVSCGAYGYSLTWALLTLPIEQEPAKKAKAAGQGFISARQNATGAYAPHSSPASFLISNLPKRRFEEQDSGTIDAIR